MCVCCPLSIFQTIEIKTRFNDCDWTLYWPSLLLLLLLRHIIILTVCKHNLWNSGMSDMRRWYATYVQQQQKWLWPEQTVPDAINWFLAVLWAKCIFENYHIYSAECFDFFEYFVGRSRYILLSITSNIQCATCNKLHFPHSVLLLLTSIINVPNAFFTISLWMVHWINSAQRTVVQSDCSPGAPMQLLFYSDVEKWTKLPLFVLPTNDIICLNKLIMCTFWVRVLLSVIPSIFEM